MTHQNGHSAPTSCACTAPSGKAFASGSYDRSIVVWNAENGRAEKQLSGHQALINGVDWSPDGRFLGSASSDHTARIWDLASGRELARLVGHGDDVNAIRFSPCGNRVATASFDGTVRVWSLEGRLLLVAGHHASDVNSVAWFPDGKRLVAGSDDRTVSIFDADGGRVRRILSGHSDWVDDVAVHPDGSLIASACLDGSVSIFETATGRRRFRIEEARCVVKAVAFSPDGTELASAAYDGCIRVYDTRSFALLETYRYEGLWNRTLAWSPRGWITGSFSSGPTLLGRTGNLELGGHATHGINSFAFAKEGTALVCSDDGGVYEVDLDGRGALGEVARHRAAVLCAAVSSDGARFATGSWDRHIRVWDRKSGELTAEWPGLGDPVNAIAFHPSDTSLFAGTFNGDVVQWDLATGQTRVLGRHRGSVKSIAAMADGVISVGRDGMIHHFVDDRDHAFRAGTTILNDVSVFGSRLATASRRDGVQLWDASGRLLGQFQGHPCSAKSVAFSEDGQRIAASYYDGHVGIWDPAKDSSQVLEVADASLSKIASRASRFVASAWDSEGSLLVVDPDADAIQRISVAA